MSFEHFGSDELVQGNETGGSGTISIEASAAGARNWMIASAFATVSSNFTQLSEAWPAIAQNSIQSENTLHIKHKWAGKTHRFLCLRPEAK